MNKYHFRLFFLFYIILFSGSACLPFMTSSVYAASSEVIDTMTGMRKSYLVLQILNGVINILTVHYIKGNITKRLMNGSAHG